MTDSRSSSGNAEPTDAQVRSACLSYRHDYGLLPPEVRQAVQFEAREWLVAWQKEGLCQDRNEIIEQCAFIVDQCNREGPYNAIGAGGRIRQLKMGTPDLPSGDANDEPWQNLDSILNALDRAGCCTGTGYIHAAEDVIANAIRNWLRASSPSLRAIHFSRWADTIEAASLAISPARSKELDALAAEVRAYDVSKL